VVPLVDNSTTVLNIDGSVPASTGIRRQRKNKKKFYRTGHRKRDLSSSVTYS
jgi:hypothetical protein